MLVMGPLVPGEEPEVARRRGGGLVGRGLRRGCGPPPRAARRARQAATPGWAGGGWPPTTPLAVGERAGRRRGPAAAGRPDEPPGLGRVATTSCTSGSWSGSPRWPTRLPACPRHVANSAAALGVPDARCDAVRCGVAVYGLSPFGDDPAEHGLRPAMRFESFVAQVKRLEPGDGTGYGRRFVGRAADLDRPGAGRLRRRRARGCCPGGWTCSSAAGGGRWSATISMDQLTFVIGDECDVEPRRPRSS